MRNDSFAAARADYLWCVRARLIDCSEDAWLAFLAGYLSIEARGSDAQTLSLASQARSLTFQGEALALRPFH